MYSDVHDGRKDTYKYASKPDTVDYGEFDARKYAVKRKTKSPPPAAVKQAKRPKMSSTVSVATKGASVKQPGVKSVVSSSVTLARETTSKVVSSETKKSKSNPHGEVKSTVKRATTSHKQKVQR